MVVNERSLFRALVVFGMFLWVSLLLMQTVDAQSTVGYSEPTNISNTDGLSTLPMIAADQYGRVHVIWAETTNFEENSPTDTGYYTVFSDEKWSDPVDVLAVQYGDSFNPYALAVDPYGRLVLVWTQSRGINISVVDTSLAGSAQAWNTTRLDVETAVNSGDLAIDDSGAYHLVYVRNNRELIYTRLTVGDTEWSNPVTVTTINRDDEGILGPSIETADGDRVFVAWTKVAAAENWAPVGVDFARSVDGGATWDSAQPIASDGRFGYPDLLLDNEQTLHVFWLGSFGTGGRYHRWSEDGGITWSDRIVVMRPEDVTGFPGSPTLLLDSADDLHVIFAGLGQGGETIWHSTWNGNDWTRPSPISGTLPDSQAPSATIGLGHEIHAAWVEYKSEDVWTTSLDTESPSVRIDVMSQQESRVPSPAASAVVMNDQSNTGPTSQASTHPRPSFPTERPVTSSSAPVTLAIAIIPVIVLIIGVGVYSVRHR